MDDKIQNMHIRVNLKVETQAGLDGYVFNFETFEPFDRR